MAHYRFFERTTGLLVQIVFCLVFCFPYACLSADVSSCSISTQRISPDHVQTPTQPIPLPEVPLQYFLDLSGQNISSFQYGTAQVPYTTAGAYGSKKDLDVTGFPTVSVSPPSDLRPWSAVGKLVWDFGTSKFCTIIMHSTSD